MIRRLSRLATSGLCLLSLLACVAVGWLWWRRHDVVEVAGGGALVRVESWPAGVSFQIVLRWPGGHESHWWSTERSAEQLDLLADQGYQPMPDGEAAWTWRGVRGWSGRAQVFLTRDGVPLRVKLIEVLGWQQWPATFTVAGTPTMFDQRAMDAAGVRLSKSLPYWSIEGVPHWSLITATGLPPLLWSGRRLHRARLRRRRRRLGLCLRCGYDLRASFGRCGECGEPIAAKGATA